MKCISKTLIFRITFLMAVFGIVYPQAQIADFTFTSDFDDDINGYSPTIYGSPSIETVDDVQVVRLEGDEFMSLPIELNESIDENQDVEIHIRFRITDTYLEEPYSGTGEYGELGRRALVSNRYFDWGALGFDIYTEFDGEDLRIIMGFGDGDNFGQRIWNVTIQEDEWIDLRMTMRLNNPKPSIVFKLNGIYNHTTLVPMYVDPTILKSSLNEQQLWFGTAMDDDMQWGNYAYAEVLVDYLTIFNPPFVGDTEEVSDALNMLIDHLTDVAPLSSSEQKDYLTVIVDNWDDNTYESISDDVLNYMTTYEEEEGSVFSYYTEWIDPMEIESPRALQFMLIQYMIDNLYTNDFVSEMEGISVLDHEILPGPIDQSAPRISGTVTLDGNYNTDPGFYLNQQEFVVRPTGYYVAPGELATVSIPETLINAGVMIHVGAQYIDLREDFRGFQRFPKMATQFPIDDSSMTITSPFGGAIYVVLPDGSNFNDIAFTFSNVIKSPYYSTKTGYSNSLSEWQSDLENAYVNWVDIESNNFQATFPRVLAEIETNADLILDPFDEIMAQFNIMTGRPLPKIRAEYMISEPQLYSQGTYPASYPISIPNGDLYEADVEALPISVINPSIFINTYDATTLIHELGHLHGIPTMYEEWETNIDVPNVMAFNNVFDMSLDSSLYYSSGFQYLDGNNAALDWILDPKFRKNLPADFNQVSYQLRGVAKYTDVGRLFTWDTLGLIHQYWYDAQIDLGTASQGSWELSPDEYIQGASDQLGLNFAPLWHIWGSIPSEEQITALDDYEKEHRIKDRILHYRNLVPNNLEEFQSVYDDIVPFIEEHHRERYDDMLSYYDSSVADSIFNVIDDILCTYFDTNCELTSVDIELDADSITLLPNPTDGLFEIIGLMESYQIQILAPNGQIIQSIHCSGNSLVIDISELPAGLHFVQITNLNNELVSLEKIIKQ